MYVIFPAAGVVEESYLSLVSQEAEQPAPTTEILSSSTPQAPAIVVEDTDTKTNR